MSRLRNTVRQDPVTGESVAIERVGGIDKANLITIFHGDTPLHNPPPSTPWLASPDFDIAGLTDKDAPVPLSRAPERLEGGLDPAIPLPIPNSIAGAPCPAVPDLIRDLDGSRAPCPSRPRLGGRGMGPWVPVKAQAGMPSTAQDLEARVGRGHDVALPEWELLSPRWRHGPPP